MRSQKGAGCRSKATAHGDWIRAGLPKHHRSFPGISCSALNAMAMHRIGTPKKDQIRSASARPDNSEAIDQYSPKIGAIILERLITIDADALDGRPRGRADEEKGRQENRSGKE